MCINSSVPLLFLRQGNYIPFAHSYFFIFVDIFFKLKHLQSLKLSAKKIYTVYSKVTFFKTFIVEWDLSSLKRNKT